VAGTVTLSSRGAYQFYAHLIPAAGGQLGTSVYDFVPNSQLAGSCGCHLKANVCAAFPATLQTQSGLTADALAELFTPEGLTHEVTANAPAMTVGGTTIVAQQPVYIFKGSRLELDVPYGSKLPVRYVRPNGNGETLSEWGAAGPITNLAACK